MINKQIKFDVAGKKTMVECEKRQGHFYFCFVFQQLLQNNFFLELKRLFSN